MTAMDDLVRLADIYDARAVQLERARESPWYNDGLPAARAFRQAATLLRQTIRGKRISDEELRSPAWFGERFRHGYKSAR